MKTAYLGLGSNLGDRERYLRTALSKLQKRDLRLKRVSSFYETEPMGLREQPWFLNIAAEFETELRPLQLLARIRSVENRLGRRRVVKNGPRTIDIDILLYEDVTTKTPDLEIPHPRYRERRFTLAPLAELNPKLKDPTTGASIAEMLAAITGQDAQIRVSKDDNRT